MCKHISFFSMSLLILTLIWSRLESIEITALSFFSFFKLHIACGTHFASTISYLHDLILCVNESYLRRKVAEPHIKIFYGNSFRRTNYYLNQTCINWKIYQFRIAYVNYVYCILNLQNDAMDTLVLKKLKYKLILRIYKIINTCCFCN